MLLYIMKIMNSESTSSFWFMPFHFIAMNKYFSPSVLKDIQENVQKTLEELWHIFTVISINLLIFSSHILVIQVIVYLYFFPTILQERTSIWEFTETNFRITKYVNLKKSHSPLLLCTFQNEVVRTKVNHAFVESILVEIILALHILTPNHCWITPKYYDHFSFCLEQTHCILWNGF